MNIHFLACILFFMSLEPAMGMQRARDTSGDNQQIFSLSNQFQTIEEPVLDYLERSEEGKISQADLRRVCKMAYQFCDRNKKWAFTNKNFISFKEQMGKPWVESLLSTLPCLSFHNSIAKFAIYDLIDGKEWVDKYIFISEMDFEYFMKHARTLRALHFYNVPYLHSYLNSPIPCAASLKSFSCDYDLDIFDESVDLKQLGNCSQFTNLTTLSLHAGIFYSEGDVSAFFSSFPNLENLSLGNIDPDGHDRDPDGDDAGSTDDADSNKEYGKRSTNLFSSLTSLKKLNTLRVSFHDLPDLFPLTNLSPLSLKTLSIDFNEEIEEDDETYAGILPQLLGTLGYLENLSINNRRLEENELDMSKVDSNNILVSKKYPQLKKIWGNAVQYFDDRENQFHPHRCMKDMGEEFGRER